jgi:hypothetical protein
MAQYPKQEEEITQIFKRWRAAEIGCPFPFMEEGNDKS